jgi:hypothetical protein
MAANRFLSYVVNGNTSASLCRLMHVCEVKICDVETILWHCGIGDQSTTKDALELQVASAAFGASEAHSSSETYFRFLMFIVLYNYS